MIADLVRIALPALAAELDLDAIEPLPTEYVGTDRSKRIGDAALPPGAFRQGMHAWVEEAVLGAPDSGAKLPPFEELEGAKEAEMTYLFKDIVDRFKAENREEGVREGRDEGIVAGQRDLLVSMAERRFGADASRQVADALDGRPSERQLSETSDLILSCQTPEEFVGRLPH